MLKLFVNIVSIFFFLTFPAQALEKIKGPMNPLEKEKLAKPIFLKNKCAKVSIVEWKEELNSLNNEETIVILNDICNKAIDSYNKFVILSKLNTALIQTISILPKDSNYRSLNDSDFRFYFRSKSIKDGAVVPIWGYQQKAVGHIYVFNEIQIKNKEKVIINPQFKGTFSHELFHAMSQQSGLYLRHVGNKDEIEEKLAEKFALLLK